MRRPVLWFDFADLEMRVKYMNLRELNRFFELHVINVEIVSLGILGRREMWEVALMALPPISLFWREFPTGDSR
jgi:hypothetical protein